MSKSRSYTIFEIPEPYNLRGKFVYNFFVPNERLPETEIIDPNTPNPGVVKAFLQDPNKISSLRAEVPRYTQVDFFAPKNVFSSSNKENGKVPVKIENLMPEHELNNLGFSSLVETDVGIYSRIRKKVESLSKSYNLNFSESDQSKKLSSLLKVDQADVQEILSPYKQKNAQVVNSVSSVNKIPSVFDFAAANVTVLRVNKRLSTAFVLGEDDVSPLSKMGIVNIVEKESSEFLKKISKYTFNVGDFEPVFEEKYILVDLPAKDDLPGLKRATNVGYLLERKRVSGTDQQGYDQIYFPNYTSTTLIDDRIMYGQTYTYRLRSVYEIEAVISEPGADGKTATKSRIIYHALSKPAAVPDLILTEEFDPPSEPDGVLYNFNYNKEKGLIIKWQIPSGRSRDVKYFQVFRRKSIYDPFDCIAQIDFDDSAVITPKTEYVRPDKTIKTNFPLTYFEDKQFTRDSSYIYAVAAIDAHGFSSGYSVQTQVGFDKIKNRLILKLISQEGAPKQYPNFYVDPRMDENFSVDSFSLDAIFDSGHKKFDIYFTPDTRLIKDSDKEVQAAFVCNTDGAGTGYYFHFINLDLQKSDTLQIEIEDLRKK